MSNETSFAAVNAGTRPRFGYSITTSRRLSTGSFAAETAESLRVVALPSLGTEFSSSMVYGCLGALKIWSALPASTVKPSFITRILSARSATTPMSWVISSTAELSLSLRLRMRSRISACTVTSRAVVGSSAISSPGSQASDCAIMARWRCPPDSWCGYLSTEASGFGISTMVSSSIARARAASVEMSK